MIPAHIAQWSLNKTRERLLQSAEMPAHIPGQEDIRKRERKKQLPPGSEQTEPRVLEFGGDGGTPPPPRVDPMEEARAQDWAKQQEFERQRVLQEQKDKEAAAEKAAKEAAWTSGRSNAYNQARQYGTSRLGSMGMSDDPYGIGLIYGQRIDAANSGLQQGADYSSTFSPTIFDEVLGQVRGSQRGTLKSQFNKSFDPYYGEDLFGATSDDAILATILDEQYNDAAANIQNAFSRGQINQAQFDRAMSDLANEKTVANSDLQNIGAGVRQRDIENIGNRRTSALDRISEWDFGDEFDAARESQRLKQYGTELMSGLEGELRGAAGGKKYFDPSALIGGAKSAIGDQTTPTSDTAGPTLGDFNTAGAADQTGGLANDEIVGTTTIGETKAPTLNKPPTTTKVAGTGTGKTGLDALATTFKNQAQKSNEGIF